jgi:hypothetical protein
MAVLRIYSSLADRISANRPQPDLPRKGGSEFFVRYERRILLPMTNWRSAALPWACGLVNGLNTGVDLSNPKGAVA